MSSGHTVWQTHTITTPRTRKILSNADKWPSTYARTTQALTVTLSNCLFILSVICWSSWKGVGIIVMGNIRNITNMGLKRSVLVAFQIKSSIKEFIIFEAGNFIFYHKFIKGLPNHVLPLSKQYQYCFLTKCICIFIKMTDLYYST